MFNIVLPFKQFSALLSGLTTATLLTFSIWGSPSLAADPFRVNNPHPIGDKTEAAFRTWFEQGNYREAKAVLDQAEAAEPNEPLVYALKASLLYLEQDWNGVKNYAAKTRNAATALSQTDSLRGNLYIGASIFLEGAAALGNEADVVKAAPQVLGRLREVFQYLDAAEKIAPNDPELNLIKGYMDLMLANYLPFSDRNQAIQRLETQAMPRYLAYRGIALGYRQLNQSDQALEFINKALAETPNNPEALYLKAQILASKGKQQNNNAALLEEAKKMFQAALAKPDQLPRRLVAQIFYEQCKTLNRLDQEKRACDPLRDTIRDGGGTWGPVALPPL